MRKYDKLDRWVTERAILALPVDMPIFFGLTPRERKMHRQFPGYYQSQGPSRKRFRDAVRALCERNGADGPTTPPTAQYTWKRLMAGSPYPSGLASR